MRRRVVGVRSDIGEGKEKTEKEKQSGGVRY